MVTAPGQVDQPQIFEKQKNLRDVPKSMRPILQEWFCSQTSTNDCNITALGWCPDSLSMMNSKPRDYKTEKELFGLKCILQGNEKCVLF